MLYDQTFGQSQDETFEHGSLSRLWKVLSKEWVGTHVGNRLPGGIRGDFADDPKTVSHCTDRNFLVGYFIAI